MKRINLIVLILFILLPVVVHSADIVYVSSRQTQIYQDTSLASEILTILKKDHAVELLDQQGVWLKVKASTIVGWVSRYSVSSTKPYSEKVSIFALLKNFFRTDNKRARLALVSTAGGVRGLTDQQSDAIGKTDFASVKIIENIDISEGELDDFVAGNLD